MDPNAYNVTNNVYEDNGLGKCYKLSNPKFPVYCGKLMDVKVT